MSGLSSAKSKSRQKPGLLCVCALPPPYHGVTVANELLTRHPSIGERYNIIAIPLHKPRLELGGKFYLATLASDLTAIFQVIGRLITSKPDVTYFCLSQTRLGMWRDACWIWSASLLGSKLLSHLHGGYFRHFFDKDLGRLQQFFCRRTLARIDGLIVLDQCFKKLFDGLVKQERIFVLPNGITAAVDNTEFAAATARREFSQRLRVIFLSNLIPGKGYDTMLAAANLMNRSGHDGQVLFRLVGAPGNSLIAAEVDMFVKDHNLGNTVQISGKIVGREKWRLLLDSDVFVLPTSLMEGQPIAIIEALAAGLPVIATPQGAIPSMVQDGLNGYIVPAGNSAAIVERLNYLRDNQEVRQAMGRASRELYLANYTEDMFVKRFVDIIANVLVNN